MQCGAAPEIGTAGDRSLCDHHANPMNVLTPATLKRCLIVDDHPIFRQGLIRYVGQIAELAVCAEAENSQRALQAMREMQPDLVLMDIAMPGTNGIEAIKMMLAEQPRLKVLIVSAHEESLDALRALRAGAKGYVMKDRAADYVIEAIREVLNDGIYVSPEFRTKLVFRAIQGSDGELGSPVDKLSDRELEVLQHLGLGETTRQVADMLRLSVKTIETHQAHIKKKLGFKGADELKKFAIEWRMATET